MGSQVITLDWFDTDPLLGNLSRNLSLSFSLNTTSITPVYRVSMVTSVYELSRSQEVLVNGSDPGNNSTVPITRSVSRYINMTAATMNPLMFVVPQNRSFLCEESLTVEMLAELVTTDKTTKDKLQKATITMKTFQFDAFRPDKFASSQFQPAISCISSQGDLVPIMVGCALAGLVLIIWSSTWWGGRLPRFLIRRGMPLCEMVVLYMYNFDVWFII